MVEKAYIACLLKILNRGTTKYAYCLVDKLQLFSFSGGRMGEIV
jgi:hypothetical protein